MKYRNARYTEFGTVTCEIEHPDFGWIPYHAKPDDPEEHGRIIYEEIIQDGNIAPYTPPPPPTEEEIAEAIRAERNQLLRETDWTQLADVPQATKDLWDEYRQALRDVPQQEGFPFNVIWPEKPEGN